MASERSYLSGAMKRKQREARLENAAKTRRALEDLSWCLKTTTSNETDSELHNISIDQQSETSINIYDHPDIATTPTTSKSLSENQESSTDQQISNLDDNKGQQSEEQYKKNSVEIVTNPSAPENKDCIIYSNIGETSHFGHTDSSTIPVNDPST